jgi:hypothetical protein
VERELEIGGGVFCKTGVSGGGVWSCWWRTLNMLRGLLCIAQKAEGTVNSLYIVHNCTHRRDMPS